MSALDVASRHYGIFPVRWLMLDQFRSDFAIRDVHVPVLVVHGEEDNVIPISSAKRLFETLLHGGFARRVLTSRRLRSCHSSEYRTPELVHPVEGLDGNCNFSRTTGIVA